MSPIIIQDLNDGDSSELHLCDRNRPVSILVVDDPAAVNGPFTHIRIGR